MCFFDRVIFIVLLIGQFLAASSGVTTAAAFPVMAATCPDFNGNGRVDIGDLRTIVDHWWQTPTDPDWQDRFDRDGDGDVDVVDVMQVAAALDTTCPPTPTPTSTPTPTPTPSTVSFAVIGDYGSAGQGELDVANLVKSWTPAFIITTGDNNYPSGAASTIDRNIGQYYHDFIYPYTGSYGAGATTNRFFPSLGNHDWNTAGAAPYLEYFTLPGNERYYDFTWGPVHLFAVDSDRSEPDGISGTSTQGAWLQGRLAASNSCWNLVYFHHAPYSSGPHGSNARLQWPFQAWGADAVLSGHDHDYERIILNGFPYFVNGLGGASKYSFGIPVPGSQVRYNAKFGAMRVSATPTTITYEFIAIDGTVVDTYSVSGGCSQG